LKPQAWPWVCVVQGNEERRSGSSSSVPISQLEDLMRRRGVDAAWDALEDAWTVSDKQKNLGKPRIGWTTKMSLFLSRWAPTIVITPISGFINGQLGL